MPFEMLLILLIVVAISGLCVAHEYERGMIFRLGRYQECAGPGCIGSFR